MLVCTYILPSPTGAQNPKNRFFFSFSFPPFSFPFIDPAYDELTDSVLPVDDGSGRATLRALVLLPNTGGRCGCCGGGASRVKYRSS